MTACRCHDGRVQQGVGACLQARHPGAAVCMRSAFLAAQVPPRRSHTWPQLPHGPSCRTTPPYPNPNPDPNPCPKPLPKPLPPHSARRTSSSASRCSSRPSCLPTPSHQRCAPAWCLPARRPWLTQVGRKALARPLHELLLSRPWHGAPLQPTVEELGAGRRHPHALRTPPPPHSLPPASARTTCSPLSDGTWASSATCTTCLT